MTQAEAVRAWFAGLDDVDRRRLLRLAEDDVLPEDLATALSMAGVTVIPLDPSPVDGRPAGYVPPAELLGLLDELRPS